MEEKREREKREREVGTMRAGAPRTMADKAHRAFVSLLGVVTVVSGGYFCMNAYAILSQVYGQGQGQGQGPTAAAAVNQGENKGMEK